MFKKLKIKFILTNLLTSTAVLSIAFSAIYVIASSSAQGRMPHSDSKNHSEQSALEGQNPAGNQTNSQNPAESPAENQTDGQAPPEIPTDQNDFKNNSEVSKYLEEQLQTERDAALKSLLISLVTTGVAVELIVALISISLAEKSIKPVRDAYQAQKDFVANASHEIKTPLAVIQANLEAADVKGNKWLDNVAKKAEDLTVLNNQLLALARSESSIEEVKPTELKLNQTIGELVGAFEAKAQESNKKLNYSSSLPDNYTTKLNRQAFEQIVNIYIDNGIKYAKKTITVHVEKDHISVISDGEPLEKSKLDHIFDRFYQSDKTSEGVGLGLAIARTIAEKNGWKVYAKVDKDSRNNIFVLNFK